MQGFWIYFLKTFALVQLAINYKLLIDKDFIIFQRALNNFSVFTSWMNEIAPTENTVYIHFIKRAAKHQNSSPFYEIFL